MEKKFNLASNDIKNIFTFLIENIHEEIKAPIQQNNNFDLNQINKQDRAGIYKFFLNNKFKPENTTIISNNFFGINETYIQCPNCRIFNFNYNIFKLIEFTIEEVYPNILNKVRMLIENERNKSYLITMNNLYKKIISLDFFFEYYRNYNHIKNNFICNHCQVQTSDSLYYNNLVFLPNILCIVLNRNSEQRITVDFPENLDISKYLDNFVNIKKYELIGVISYDENNNYFSISRIGKDWYFYQNDNIMKCNILDAKNKGRPYILFYHK